MVVVRPRGVYEIEDGDESRWRDTTAVPRIANTNLPRSAAVGILAIVLLPGYDAVFARPRVK